jgi:hypothetical protein
LSIKALVLTVRKSIPAFSEKLLHHLGRASGQDPTLYFHMMIQAGVIYHLQNRMDSAGLRIVGTIHQAAESRMNRRSRAHGARLNCSKQFAVAEPVITDVSSGFAQGHDFSVGGWIAVSQIAIPPPANHTTFAYHDCPNRYLACLQCALCAADGFLHPNFVRRSIVGFKFSFLSAQK